MKKLLQMLLSITLALPMAGRAVENTELAIYNEQTTRILVTTEQPVFMIKLRSNPSTGYAWFLTRYDPRYLKLLKHRFEAADHGHRMGAPGHEWWIFKMKPAAFVLPCQTSVQFTYLRPWIKNKPAIHLAFQVVTLRKNNK